MNTSSPAAPVVGRIKATHKAKAGLLFISATTYRRMPIFRYRQPCEIFFENLEFYRAKYNFRLHAYVLMPDHFHLLIYFPPDCRLADFLRDFKSAVGVQIVHWLKTKRIEPRGPRRGECEGYSQLLSRLALRRPRQRRKDPHYALWQRDSYITPLLNAKMVRQRLNYIHDNPRREKLISNLVDYAWSSAPLYAGQGNAPVCVDLLELPYD